MSDKRRKITDNCLSMPEEKVLGAENEGVSRENIPTEREESPKSPEAVPMQEKEASVEINQERALGKYKEILSKVPSGSAPSIHSDEDVSLDAKSIGATLDEESKIQKLIDLAQTKGVVHAVKVAQHLNDFYALDRMHDELADKFYDALVAKGMIKVD